MVGTCVVGFLFAVVVRWLISLHDYSGYGKPPLFGDFEAQRHWMEITYNLPVHDWYRQTPSNDLLYWGLDYPPLTAYHSFICGYIQSKMNSSWIELNKSQGIQDADQKLFMRLSVIVPDVLLYMPAVLFYFLKCCKSTSSYKKESGMHGAFLMLLYPGLMLIDHGHFQYNCISLGLFLWSVNMMCCSQLLSAVLFVLAINYKQMELHHALVFFFYLLGRITFSLKNLIKLSLVVIVTFSLCWFPFCWSIASIRHVLVRLFPFNRGLFEDKVSNFWCSLSLLVKLKQKFSEQQLINISLVTTLFASLPSLFCLFLKPSMKQFKLSLFNVSMCFFLFSYQVHEKTILITAISSIVIYLDHKKEVSWFLIVSTFSMLPLFVKDNLVIPAISCSLIFYILSNVNILSNKPTLFQQRMMSDFCGENNYSSKYSSISDLLVHLSLISMTLITIIVLMLQPPSHLPDLFTVSVTSFSCLHFIMFLIYFNCQQLRDFVKVKAN
ncbi:hypothetical protein HELRODRAFT_73543 [Helobdella robusta]|uniref:Alpha-1,3-glucosyltransferase n=1 Tax=Helobdella robusta TaxID=6412 RepID=T1G1F7_HELRO|nr:hypothetical protein HELRODRAFT_73543 [Helobdella robusta]ESO09262.1 hypothetical protein HELRODRAFT_73543 [Helobdella robusta]